MIPVQELLSRIRWDREFGEGRFEIGYFDHVQQEIIRVPFEEISFGKRSDFSFRVQREDGELLTIPFHRVREVYKEGHLIWCRPL